MKYSICILLACLSQIACQNDLKEADKSEVISSLSLTEVKESSVLPEAYESAEKVGNTAEISDNCADAIMDLASSAARVKAAKSEIMSQGAQPSILISEEKPDERGDYFLKLGINGDLRFETIMSLRFNSNTQSLFEIDWLSGEEKEIDYDKLLLKGLPRGC